MGGAAAVVAFAVRDGLSRRWEGGLLIGDLRRRCVSWVFLAGDR